MPSGVKCVIYGPEGIGKSTLASQFPAPIFIDTEGSTRYLDVDRFDRPTSWEMLMGQVRYIKDNPGIYKTLVIDTGDWAEKLCIDHICAKHNVDGLEGFGYGKGYVYLKEEFGRLLNLLTEICDLGVNIVLVCHAQMRKFERPDELGSYDRWELKLSKNVAPMTKEWADMVFFCNYKTVLVQDPKTKTMKPQGGERVLYTSHHNCWDAKTRAPLPDMVLLEYASIAGVIPGSGAVAQPRPQPQTPIAAPASPPTPPAAPASTPAPQAPVTQPNADAELNEFLAQGATIEPEDPAWSLQTPAGASANMQALYDLMRADSIYPAEVEGAVYEAGFYPEGSSLDIMADDFIGGCLVAGWQNVKKMILSKRIATN